MKFSSIIFFFLSELWRLKRINMQNLNIVTVWPAPTRTIKKILWSVRNINENQHSLTMCEQITGNNFTELFHLPMFSFAYLF